tara:strand:- start:4194 stop:4337 length:144 start_codon:yes stop_codon:yes gene_type:complete
MCFAKLDIPSGYFLPELPSAVVALFDEVQDLSGNELLGLFAMLTIDP